MRLVLSLYLAAQFLSLSLDARDLKSCATSLASALGISVQKVEKSLSVSETATCLENVPPKYRDHPSFMILSADPDQGFRIYKQSLREAMAALELVDQGRVPGPVERTPKDLFADFRDAEGNGFDIKAYSSPRTPTGKVYDPGELLAEVLKKMNRPYVNPKTGQPSSIRVFVDLTWLTDEDRERTRAALSGGLTESQLALVEYLELPEPQPRFRRPDAK